MLQREHFGRGWLSTAMAALSFSVLVGVFAVPAHLARAQDASKIDEDVHKALDNKKYSGVNAQVRGGDVVLTGSVERYADKEEADNRIHHVKGVKGVDNEIQVASGGVSDEVLRDQLAKKLATYTEGYGTTEFTSLTIGVKDGVATLGGTVYWQPDKDAAVGLAANTPGVKDIVDDIQVAPLSPMDDDIRLRVARAIYGTSALEKYAVNPVKPIRIIVINGNVTLTGVVDSKMDHDLAGVRASSVSGVFKVTNNLQIAGPHSGQ